MNEALAAIVVAAATWCADVAGDTGLGRDVASTHKNPSNLRV